MNNEEIIKLPDMKLFFGLIDIALASCYKLIRYFQHGTRKQDYTFSNFMENIQVQLTKMLKQDGVFFNRKVHNRSKKPTARECTYCRFKYVNARGARTKFFCQTCNLVICEQCWHSAHTDEAFAHYSRNTNLSPDCSKRDLSELKKQK